MIDMILGRIDTIKITLTNHKYQRSMGLKTEPEVNADPSRRWNTDKIKALRIT